MGATTSVTARLCPMCLEDVIKGTFSRDKVLGFSPFQYPKHFRSSYENLVVIDYRNDPKASTGNFEMIYRQVIPPAPAYLGLNLVLKGTQVMTKNGTGKKEKSKLEVKSKIDKKSSQLSVKLARDLNGDHEKTPILSPRSLLIDFNDGKENSSPLVLSSARKNTLLSLGKGNKENVLTQKSDKVLSGRLNSYLALTRYPSKRIEIKEKENLFKKSMGKTPESSRRHASCGPKLMSINAPEEKKIENPEVMEDDRSKIKCVGNKYGPEIEVNDSTMESAKSSPRKQETPRVSSIRGKLKPVNTLSKSAKTVTPSSRDKPLTNSNEYRKYLSQSSLQLNRMPSKMNIHNNYYNSHFYAVGMSLRAWRSKYNRSKTNAVTSTTTNNSGLKGKST